MNQLKEVRETSFLDLNEISDHLSIPKLYLQAIEEGNFSHLPHKKHLAERYITSYADFLEVDVSPIIHSYRNFQRPEQTLTSRRRGKRGTRSMSKGRTFWYTYRYYFFACGICLFLAVCIWLFIPSGKSESINSLNSPKNQSPTISINKERPIFTLQKAASDSSVEQTWFISQAESIHVQIQPLEGSVSFRIREDSVKGNVIANKELSKSESFDLSGKKWVFVYLDDPSNVLLKVNDVVIDTVSQKKGTTYEFKIASN